MTTQVHLEVWLICGYAVFLLVTAAVLERVARHSHRRSHRIQTAGFDYRREIDAWECPAGQFLTRSAIDDRRQIVVYRAPARACNLCALKANCTDSDEGREVTSYPEAWVHSEIGRFHRGMSLTLCGLAALISVIEIARHHAPFEQLALAATLLASIFAARRLAPAIAAPLGASDQIEKVQSESWRNVSHRGVQVSSNDRNVRARPEC